MNAEKFMNVVRKHTSFEELTPTLLREFVEKIVVHECSYDENKAHADRTLRFIILLLARWTCPNNRPTYPTQYLTSAG